MPRGHDLSARFAVFAPGTKQLGFKVQGFSLCARWERAREDHAKHGISFKLRPGGLQRTEG